MISFSYVGRRGPKILLLHGLYSSSGVWIPALKFFKDYQLTLVTIDYHKAFLANCLPDLVREALLNLTDCYEFSIGHSFGSLFLSNLGLSSKKNIFIAPPFVASEFFFDRYIKFISSTTELKQSDIDYVVKEAINMNESTILKLRASDVILLPSSDEFFTYDSSIHPVNYFAGTHSSIELAINSAFLNNKILC